MRRTWTRLSDKLLFKSPPIGLKRLSQEAVDWYKEQEAIALTRVGLCFPLVACGPVSWGHWPTPIRLIIGALPSLYCAQVLTNFSITRGAREFELGSDGEILGLSKRVFRWRVELHWVYVVEILCISLCGLAGLAKY
jgi:hypothetical protein